MDLVQVFSHIESKYPWVLRTFWTPILKYQFLSQNKYITKFGGSNPCRGSNFRWPKCDKVHGDDEEVCGQQKFFCCQVNIGDLPDEMKNYIGMDSGIFQIFYCQKDKMDPDLKLIPKKELIPSLKTLAAINIFEKNINTDKLPDSLIKFVEDTNEEFDEAVYQIKRYKSQKEEVQLKIWRKSDFKEIPSSHELKSIAPYDEILESVPHYDNGVIGTSLPISIPDDDWLQHNRRVKLFGYVKDMGCHGNEHYPECLDCGLPKNVTFLNLCYFNNDFSITLCPGCGKPGSV